VEDSLFYIIILYNLFGSFATPYSCWPVMLTIYNLLPGMCMRSKFIFYLRSYSIVRNKAHIETSICEVYIVDEISIIISYYFKPQLKTRINCVSKHDDGREVSLCENLSIFSPPGWPVPKNVVMGRYLSEIEFKQAHNYVIFNCDELRPFIQ